MKPFVILQKLFFLVIFCKNRTKKELSRKDLVHQNSSLKQITLIYTGLDLSLYRKRVNGRNTVYRIMKRRNRHLKNHEIRLQTISPTQNCIFVPAKMAYQYTPGIFFSLRLPNLYDHLNKLPRRTRIEAYYQFCSCIMNFCQSGFCTGHISPDDLIVTFIPQLNFRFSESTRLMRISENIKSPRDIFTHPAYIKHKTRQGKTMRQIAWSLLIIMALIELKWLAEELTGFFPEDCFKEHFNVDCLHILLTVLTTKLSDSLLKIFIITNLKNQYEHLMSNISTFKFQENLLKTIE